jgi:hypothetical protein
LVPISRDSRLLQMRSTVNSSGLQNSLKVESVRVWAFCVLLVARANAVYLLARVVGGKCNVSQSAKLV